MARAHHLLFFFFPAIIVPFYVLANSTLRVVPHFNQHLVWSVFVNFTYSSEYTVISHCDISLKTNDADHYFTCL